MKYLLFTLLCSLSIAQAMERQSLIRTKIEHEESTIASELDTLSRTNPNKKDPLALWEKELSLQRLKSRHTQITDMLQWIRESNPDHKEVSAAFLDYQRICDRLREKATVTKVTAAYWEGLAKKAPIQNTMTSATLGTFTEDDEEDEELVTAEQAPTTRSQSVTVARPIITPVAPRRPYSAPIVHHSRAKYFSPLSLTSISETDEPATANEEEQPAGALVALFAEQGQILPSA